jgi:hypothetical protein
MTNGTNKTQATAAPVAAFIAAVPDARRREEAAVIDGLLRRLTGHEPAMWGPSIIGYGRYRYRYDSGREGEMCRAGFSPRKAALTLYLTSDFDRDQDRAEALFARLGPHSRGKSCLYIKRLDAIAIDALEELLALDWAVSARRYPED